MTNCPPPEVIFGVSNAMAAVRQVLERAAARKVPVLIWGESGTGKDLLARYIHQISPWASGPFVKLNCAAIPGPLLESELFGYDQGAFTGAANSKPGRIELADQGTLFLDEISELEWQLQSKFLQVLQDGQFCRIGATEDSKLDARLVCATNRRLEKEIEVGRFREDLFFRINVVSVYAPPLRERAVDIPILTEYFLALYNEKYNCNARRLSSKALVRLQQHDWPGNIRELENAIRRYVILGDTALFDIDSASVPGTSVPSVPEFELPLDAEISLKELTKCAMLEFERKVILRVLEKHNWNRKKSARALNISYRALLYKLQDTGLCSSSKELDERVAASPGQRSRPTD